MTKKLICCLLVLCMALSFCGTAVSAAADTSISVTASKEGAENGEEVSFTFVLNNPGKKAIEGVQFSVAASAGLTFLSVDKLTESFLQVDYVNSAFFAVIGKAETSEETIELMTLVYSVAEGTQTGAILPVGVDNGKEVLVFHYYQSDSGAVMEDLSCDVSHATASVTVTSCSGGHTMDGGTVTKQPTCTEPGERTYTCTVCGYTEKETIPATGHIPAEAVNENVTAATCEQAGSCDEVFYCSVCGSELSRTTKTSPASGHDWGAWVTEQNATEEQDGLMRRTCQNDPSHVEEKIIPKLAHQHVLTAVQETPATCTEAGTAAHWTCGACGARFADSSGETEVSAEDLVIPAKGHVPGDPEHAVTKLPTCTESGQRTITRKCTVCLAVCETTTEAIPPNGHVPGDPVVENVTPGTAQEAGHHDEAVYCTVCQTELSRTLVYEPVDAPAVTGHPAHVSVIVGEAAAFTVSAEGVSLSYQWQESRDGGVSWTDSTESGDTTNTLSMTASAVHNGRTYRCLVSNPGGTVISSAARLTVAGARITRQPADVTVEKGEQAVFTVKATGTDLAYQWQVSKDGGTAWADCTETGCSTDTLTLLPDLSCSGWRYRCRITGSGLIVVSESALLTVSAGKPEFKTQNLVLSGQIGVNFFLDLDGLTEEERSASYMEFSISGKGATTTTDPFDANHMNASRKYYGFTCYVRSIQMADTITATFHYGNGKTISKTYSVEEYFGVFDEHASENPAKTVALVHSIADYGHYMQIYLASVNGFSIGTDYAELSRHYTDSYDYADILSKVEAHAIARALEGSKVEKANYRLQLGSETTLDVFLKTTDGSAPTNVTVMISEQVTGNTTTTSVTPEKQADGRYLVTVPNISAHKLGDVISISGSAGGFFTVDVSPLSFVRDVLTHETAAESRAGLSSLYAYYAAAVAYKKS